MITVLITLCAGESNPVLKYPLPHTDDTYNAAVHKKHTLFCGTRVIQTKSLNSPAVLLSLLYRYFLCYSCVINENCCHP